MPSNLARNYSRFAQNLYYSGPGGDVCEDLKNSGVRCRWQRRQGVTFSVDPPEKQQTLWNQVLLAAPIPNFFKS
ncbi:MAG: hypothetical protein CMJ81_11345 [Planctomycetaceae bacterium]|nr:hypothetical protein [Planctomycetaceae bacterium]